MEYEKTYENGLRLVVKPMEGLLSVTMGIIVGTGAAYENDKEDGISHFIEHMQFKGTKTNNAFDISDKFDKMGSQVNAFTGKDSTCYYSKSTYDHTEESFALLTDLFLNSTFPVEEMDREKGVILEEISMSDDDPEGVCLELLSSAYYGNDTFGRTILGPQSNVKGFTRDDILNYKKKRYCPQNIVVSFAGKIDFNMADELMKKYMSNIYAGEYEERKIVPNFNKKNMYKIKETEQAHIAMALPGLPRKDDNLVPLQIVNNVLGGSMSSRLFQEVREKRGLAYTVYSYLSSYENCGTMNIYAGLNPKNLKDGYDAILTELHNIQKIGINEKEFLRAKEQIKSSTIFSQESTSSQMLLYGKYMLYHNELFNNKEYVEEIDKVTLDDVKNVLENVFNPDKIVLASLSRENLLNL